jgi:polyferredoxin
LNQDFERGERTAAALNAGGGAALGLAAGVVLAQGLSWLVFFLWGEAAARAVWQILSPLSALALAVGGSLFFRNRWADKPWMALAISLALLAVLVVLCFWLGFPWPAADAPA